MMSRNDIYITSLSVQLKKPALHPHDHVPEILILLAVCLDLPADHVLRVEVLSRLVMLLFGLLQLLVLLLRTQGREFEPALQLLHGGNPDVEGIALYLLIPQQVQMPTVLTVLTRGLG